MKPTTPLSTPVWVRQRALPDQAFAPVLALASEFRRAIAATSRYEQLKLERRASDDPAASPARRTYLEFYSKR